MNKINDDNKNVLIIIGSSIVVILRKLRGYCIYGYIVNEYECIAMNLIGLFIVRDSMNIEEEG
jgi:hypothetical protein